ncbi:hypothetical protein ACJX0J_019648, partial [Zea mays]
LFLLALDVRAMNKHAEYDSDAKIIAIGRSPTMRQPLIHAQNVPATSVPVPTLDQLYFAWDVFGLLNAGQVNIKLQHYFQSHHIILPSYQPLKDIIRNREVVGRVANGPQ